MKIFSFVGSRNGKNSNTFKVIEQFIQEIQHSNYEQNIQHISFDPETLSLINCKGCVACFKHGFCPQDKFDGFDNVKRIMLESDIIIFGTPVYAASVSGDMKVFIDRISFWLHLMAFAGKLGIVVVTASSNSVMETSSYLRKIMESMGLCVACSILCTIDAPNIIDNPSFKSITLPNYAKMLNMYLNGKKKIESTDYQEKYFINLKQTHNIPISIDLNNAELRYWHEKELLSFNTYNELLEKLQKQMI